MKRFLSVLASLSIVGSAAVATVSCGSQQNHTQNIFNKVNNQLITIKQEPSKLTVANYKSAIDDALIKKTGLSANDVAKIAFLNNNQDVATGFVPNRIGFNVNGESQYTGYFNLGFIQKFSQSLKRMRMILPSGTNGDISSPESEGIKAIQKAIVINNPLVTAAEASNFKLLSTSVQSIPVSTDLNKLSFTKIKMSYLGQIDYTFRVMIPQNGVFRSQAIARSFVNESVVLPSWVNNSTTNDLTKQIIIDKLVETNQKINFTSAGLFKLSNITLKPETVSPSNDVNITIQENSSQSPVNKAIQVVLKPKISDTAEAIINSIKNTNLQLNLLYSSNLDNRNTLLALRNELYELNKDNNLKESDLDAIYFRLPSSTSTGTNRLINGTNTVELLLILSGSAVSVPSAQKAVTISYQSKSQSENGLTTILPQLMGVASAINLDRSTNRDISNNNTKQAIVKNFKTQLDLDPFNVLEGDLPSYLQSPDPSTVTEGVETEVTFKIGKTVSATSPTGSLDILIAATDQETADSIINSITVTDIFLPSWGVDKDNRSIANNNELQLNLKSALYYANQASGSSLSVSQLQYIFFRSSTPLVQGQSITANIYASFGQAESRDLTLTIRWRTVREDLVLVKGALENTNLEITWPSSASLPTTADENTRSLVWAELRTLFPRLNEPYKDISAKKPSYKSYFYDGFISIEQKTIPENFTEFRITLDIDGTSEVIPVNLKVILS